VVKMKTTVRSPEPFLFPAGKEIGVLLIHGFTGTTAELRPLGKHLHAQGYTVHAPLLKGHGVSPENMSCTTWVDWWASAREGYERLKQEGCQEIVVMGLSMGGLLALKIAQYQPVLGIATLCAPIKVRDKRLGMVRYLQHVMPYKKRIGQKAEHIERELYHYDRTPLSCVVSLAKLMENTLKVIPHIHQPILIVQADRDETVDPCSGDLLYKQIGSSKKQLIRYPNSTHIITLDKDREELFEDLTAFIRELEKGKHLIHNVDFRHSHKEYTKQEEEQI
jgi:carboxylesterase